ncbi:hypothetical protein GGF41_005906 [Coemansia sp. RSA 2531]|nr:hypothetical protein GGF41_005906 [Coemansia sp. RSA 2531]
MSTEYLTEGFVPEQASASGDTINEAVDKINQAIRTLGQGYNDFPAFEVPDEDTVNRATNRYVWPNYQNGVPSDRLLRFYKGHNGNHVVVEIIQKISSRETWLAQAHTVGGFPAWYNC